MVAESFWRDVFALKTTEDRDARIRRLQSYGTGMAGAGILLIATGLVVALPLPGGPIGRADGPFYGEGWDLMLTGGLFVAMGFIRFHLAYWHVAREEKRAAKKAVKG